MRNTVDTFLIVMVAVVMLVCATVGLRAVADHQEALQGRYADQYEQVNR